MKKLLLFFLTFHLLLIGCNSQPTITYDYQIPEQLQDDVPVATLATLEIDTVLLARAIQEIHKGRIGEVHSLLMYKNDVLVVEEYFPGHRYQWDAPYHRGTWVEWNRSMPHSVQSVTKSVTSACIGIAIEKGYIQNAEQSIFYYLPDHRHLATGGREKITIEHLLTMTSGLEWEEWNAPYSSTENPIIGIWFSKKDPVTFILEGTLTHEPGANYTYYGGHQILLGEILRNATGMGIDEFSEKYLFSPLSISDANWAARFDNGVIEAAGGLQLKPRDMLKVGITYLDGGKWKETQVLSASWIKKSATPFAGNTNIKLPGKDAGKYGYSYSWWTKEVTSGNTQVSTFWALGWGDQRIYVLPKLNSVVVLTGGNHASKPKSMKLLRKYLIPALK